MAWDFSRHALSTDKRGARRAHRAPATSSARCWPRCSCCSRSSGSRSASRPAAARPRSISAPPRRRRCCWRCSRSPCSRFAGALAASHRGFTGSDLPRLRTRSPTRNATVPPNTPGRLTAVAQRARALLERGAEGLQGPPGARRGRGGLRNRAPALPHRDRSTSDTRTASSCRRSPTSASSGSRSRSRCSRLDGRGRARHAPVQPPLDELGDAARLARPRARRSGLAALTSRAPGALHARAHRDAQHAVPGRRVRRPLARGLDLVRARQRVRGAAVRRLAGRPRAAGGPARGRGRAHAGARARRRARCGSGSAAAAVAVAALLAAWSQWQPQRSEDARQQALASSRATRAAPSAKRRRSRATRCRPKRCSRWQG